MKSLFIIFGACLSLASATSDIQITSFNGSVPVSSRSSEQCGCGYNKYGMSACDGASGRVIGGRDAKDQEYPWQALIQICKSGKCFICGGTLLNYRYIMTAAHCLITKGVVTPISGLTVKLGKRLLASDDSLTRSYTVEKLISHGNYEEGKVRNDIALLKLTHDVEMNDATFPACIPTDESRSYVNKLAVVSGWGQTSTSSPAMSPTLKRTGLKVLANTDQYCVNGGGLGQVPIHSKLCAYTSKTDSCGGDSGGPLVVPDDGRCTVIGIVSYGIGCATDFHAGVYTRVSDFLFWIKYLTKDGGCMEARSPRKCDLTCTNARSLTGNFRLNNIQSSCSKGICYAFDKDTNLCARFNAPCQQGLKCAYSNQCDLRQVLTGIYGNPDRPRIVRSNIAGINVECNSRTGDCCDLQNPSKNLCTSLNEAIGSNVFSRKAQD